MTSDTIYTVKIITWAEMKRWQFAHQILPQYEETLNELASEEGS